MSFRSGACRSFYFIFPSFSPFHETEIVCPERRRAALCWLGPRGRHCPSRGRCPQAHGSQELPHHQRLPGQRVPGGGQNGQGLSAPARLLHEVTRALRVPESPVRRLRAGLSKFYVASRAGFQGHAARQAIEQCMRGAQVRAGLNAKVRLSDRGRAWQVSTCCSRMSASVSAPRVARCTLPVTTCAWQAEQMPVRQA